MNAADEIRKIKEELRSLNRRLSKVISGGAEGETNTASNQGVGGVGPYDTKVGVDLQFRNINAASNKISVAHDAANKEVDINIIEGNIKLDDLGTPDDNADLNAAITRHGLLKKLDNDGTHYMDGQGNWTVPAGGGGASIEFLDNFGDGARHWGWYDDAKNGTIAEAAGLLTLSIANGVNGRIDDGGQNSGPRVLLGDPGAPFEVKVKLNSYTVNNYTHAGIFICSRCNPIASGNWYMFGRARDGAVPVNGLGTWRNGNWIQTNAITTLPIYLRFRIVVLSRDNCARCQAAYSTDDITYTTLDTFYLNNLTNYDTENLTVGIFTRNGIWAGGYFAIAAPFEWFKMERTTGPG